MNSKHVHDSVTERVQMVMAAHLNGMNRLFGGQLAMWIDEVAGIVAMRHSGKLIVTACIDNLKFREPVMLGELIVLIGRVTFVGHSSMEVRVDSYVEARSGERRLINTAYLVEVAIDEEGHPVQVPSLLLETQEEQNQWQAGLKRKEFRGKMKKQIRDIFSE